MVLRKKVYSVSCQRKLTSRVAIKKSWMPTFTGIKKHLLFSFIMLFISIISTPLTFADRCPYPKEIKSLTWQGWSAYDSDNGTPIVTLEEKKKFADSVVFFSMAEWAQDAPEGSSHCYYYDKNGEYTFAFLAKHHLRVDERLAVWKNEGGFLRCHANAEDCVFINEMRYV